MTLIARLADGSAQYNNSRLWQLDMLLILRVSVPRLHLTIFVPLLIEVRFHVCNYTLISPPSPTYEHPRSCDRRRARLSPRHDRSAPAGRRGRGKASCRTWGGVECIALCAAGLLYSCHGHLRFTRWLVRCKALIPPHKWWVVARFWHGRVYFFRRVIVLKLLYLERVHLEKKHTCVFPIMLSEFLV